MRKIASIAVLDGDGIGPEIMTEGLKVLNAVGEKYGHKFEYRHAPFGAMAYFGHGHPFPEDTKKVCDDSDSILKGPIGLSLDDMKKIPPEMSPEGAGLLPLRRRYDTFANYRPVVLPASCAGFSPLKPEMIGEGLDILMMRELVGGIYFGKKTEGKDTGMQYASDECTYTRDQVERFANVCFQEAQKRGTKLTNVHKANVLATSRFWNYVFSEVAKQYPDVKFETVLVDNAAFQLGVRPTQYNGVMAFENMQGDILTDQAGGILGSLGLMPSACLNPQTGKGYYEPAHGSAPDIAGKNVANPYSMIGSVAFMLDKGFGLEDESKDVWDSLSGVFSDGYRTKELYKGRPGEMTITTTEFGDMVAGKILGK
jgi:3-isopropylmalate dehydrogenase